MKKYLKTAAFTLLALAAGFALGYRDAASRMYTPEQVTAIVFQSQGRS